MDREALVKQGLERKQACEDKASSIVEKLLEKEVNREWFRESIEFITPGHFEDIIDERAILKLCGYPLCQNELSDFRQQKYRICSKTNRVIDRTERKKFCCESCFISANHLKEQISSTPLWLRDEEEETPKDIVFKDEIKPEELKKTETKPKKVVVFEDEIRPEETETKPKLVEETPKKEQKKRQKKKAAEPSFDHILKTIKEWWTSESTRFIKGDNLPAAFEEVAISSDLLKAREEMMEKVGTFYRTDFSSVTEKVVDLDTKQPVIPTIDKKAQRSLRNGIVLKGFESGLTKVQEHLGLVWSDLNAPLKELVTTMNLTPENVILKPREWMMASILFVQILSRREISIRKLTEQPESRKFLEIFNAQVKFDQTTFIDDLMKLG